MARPTDICRHDKIEAACDVCCCMPELLNRMCEKVTGHPLYPVEEFDDSPLANGRVVTEAHFEKQITSKEAYARYDQERKRCIAIVAEAYANGMVFTVLYGTGTEEPKGNPAWTLAGLSAADNRKP